MSKFKILNRIGWLLNKHKLLIIALVFISVLPASTALAGGPTGDFSTSSAYITGVSSKDYLLPFAGFGISMNPDSCMAYANISSDLNKIEYVLSSQISAVMLNYSGASCNTKATLDDNCTKQLDTLNNLLLTYATYHTEGLVQAKDKTTICTSANTRIPGVYKNSYYGIDLVALAYASVRDSYAGKKFTDSGTLFNNLNANIVSKLNSAISASKFIDTSTIAYGKLLSQNTPLRTLAQNTLQTTTTVRAIRARVIPPPIITTLSNPNAFFFFGLTNNLTNKTIGAMPIDSFAQYVSLFNANPTRFGDLYSAQNSSLIDAGDAVLLKINSKIDLRLPPREQSTLATPIVQNTTIPPVTQKASVVNSIGSWFIDMWSSTTDFFNGLFGPKEAGAATTPTTSGPGESVNPYSTQCPGLKGAKPNVDLRLATGNVTLKPWPMGVIDTGDFYLKDILVLDKTIEDINVSTTFWLSDNKPDLSKKGSEGLAQHVRDMVYYWDNHKINNEFDSSKFTDKNIPRRTVGDAQNYLLGLYNKAKAKLPVVQSTKISGESSPYNCLRNAPTWYPDLDIFLVADLIKLTSATTIANDKVPNNIAVQSVTKGFTLTDEIAKIILEQSSYSELANIVDTHKFNQAQKK